MCSLFSVGFAIDCIIRNDPTCLRDFILYGGDFLSYDCRTGWAPIHYAGRYGRLECMKVLLHFGKLGLSLQSRSPSTRLKTSAELIAFTDSFQGLTSTSQRLQCTISRLATSARSNMTITFRSPKSNALVATPSERVKVNDTGSIVGDVNVSYPC